MEKKETGAIPKKTRAKRETQPERALDNPNCVGDSDGLPCPRGMVVTKDGKRRYFYTEEEFLRLLDEMENPPDAAAAASAVAATVRYRTEPGAATEPPMRAPPAASAVDED